MTDLVSGAKRRLAQVAVACRRALAGVAEIASGPGKGLRFDAEHGTMEFASGRYERPVQDALASLVRPGAVCYDVGANLGFFSVLLGRLAGPSGLIYAFEPVPRNAAMIERNARLNRMRNIKVLSVALSRTDGRGELLLARHVGGAVLRGAGVPVDLAGHATVETCAIDTLVGSRKIEPPDVVKIDVEGAEMDVLRGMERVLRARAPVVVLELDDETEAACEEKIALCRSFLGSLGYRTAHLPHAYPDDRWFVRHLVALRGATDTFGRRTGSE
jgi:FkbM family methyltransferase